MGKETGLGAQLYLDGTDLSGDTGEVRRISKSFNVLPFTGIDKSAFERKAGVLTGLLDWQSYFNPTNAHPKLEDLPRTDVIGSYYHRATLGVPAASMVAKQTDYKGTRAQDGGYLFDVNLLSNAWWLDWGRALTAGIDTDTGAANGTGVDFGDPTPAAYNFGAQFYLHVFGFTGTDATVKIQQSSDNGAGDAYADVTGGAFTAVTAAPFSQRLQTARNQAVERWLRVVTTTVGGFSSLQFAVSAVINITEMSL